MLLIENMWVAALEWSVRRLDTSLVFKFSTNNLNRVNDIMKNEIK